MAAPLHLTLSIRQYTAQDQNAWNEFNNKAKNGLFLFNRFYMDYHQSRFKDASVLIYQGNQLVALCPINIKDRIAYSHTGLTFGGLIIQAQIKIHLYQQIFDLLLDYLRGLQFEKFIYKAIPFIFHKQLALEDQYAMARHKAVLHNRSLSSCIELDQKITYSKGRKWALKRAKRSDVLLSESSGFGDFMELVKNTLNTKYGINPVHTAAEIAYLASRFPDNIKLVSVHQNQEMIGGTIIYIHEKVVHIQYIGLSEIGKKQNALDLVINYLICNYQAEKKYINFGISPGNDIYGLNTGLIQNKESYGSRSLPHDIYEISL